MSTACFSIRRVGRTALACASLLLMTACATRQAPVYDYTAFKASRPKSILVLPPVNNTPDVMATPAVLAQVTLPLAESGYYVMPVTLVAETFKENGLSLPPEMHAVVPAKLQQIFGADAALYLTVTRYGASYAVLDSAAVVSVSARLVDLRSGEALWSGSASASNNEGGGGNQGGIVGLLVAAVVKQILNSVTDASFPVAGMASQRLLSARPGGLLYGPRSPRYGTD